MTILKQLFHSRALDMRWRVASEVRSAELSIITSYLTNASGIIVLLITSTKYREFFPIFSLFLILSRRVQLIYMETWYNGAYTMMAKPNRTQELHYPMIQVLIICDILGLAIVVAEKMKLWILTTN